MNSVTASVSTAVWTEALPSEIWCMGDAGEALRPP